MNKTGETKHKFTNIEASKEQLRKWKLTQTTFLDASFWECTGFIKTTDLDNYRDLGGLATPMPSPLVFEMHRMSREFEVNKFKTEIDHFQPINCCEDPHDAQTCLSTCNAITMVSFCTPSQKIQSKIDAIKIKTPMLEHWIKLQLKKATLTLTVPI